MRSGSAYEKLLRRVAELESRVTRMNVLETRLRESEDRYRELVDHAPAALYEIDFENQRFISVNDIMSQYTEYSAEEFLQLDPLSLLTEDSVPTVNRLLETVGPQNPTPAAVECRIRTRHGRILWVLINSRFTFDAEGRPLRATAVVNDLTALRSAEAEKKRLEDKLAQIQKMESLGTLAGGIAHDFNNLLMGLQGNASLMLLDEGRGAGDVERLRNIESYVRRGVSLTKQLLGLARGGKYEVKTTDLNRLVSEGAAMFGRTKKEIRIHQKLQEDIWAVKCDRGQIDQVLLNIFVNAWQAMSSGGDLFIETQNTHLADDVVSPHGVSPGRYVKISIADNGIGMDAGTMARIFDPFFTTKERERGTGLGLASAYGIIKNHDGIIEVSSRVGHGSTFVIYLPAVDKAVIDEAGVDERLESGSGLILLVDDEPMILDVGRQMLERLGYTVLTASSGIDALEVYRQNGRQCDLVILDMIMPDMSGEEAFEQLHRFDPEVRVLLASGYSIHGQASRILERGCRGFIQKPFNIEALSTKIRQILCE